MSEKFRFKSNKKREKLKLISSESNADYGGAHIELFSNKEIMVDGCGRVCEYGENFIKLGIGKGNILILGSDLDIILFENKQINIKGNILSLEFCV